MNEKMTRCLEDLDARIDDRQEADHLQAWLTFLNDGWPEEIFTPPGRKPAPTKVDWPQIHINDAIEDIDLMILSQLSACSKMLAEGGNCTLSVRCNYGTGIMAFPFGCEPFIMPRETGNLPTARPLASRDRIRKLLDAGIGDYRVGMSGRVFETAERFLEVFEKYPAIGRNVWLYHPDAQGPIDIVELVWGSDMFLAFYEAPDLLRAFLELVTDAYTAYMGDWFKLVPPRAEYSVHWGTVQIGQLMIRNDSLMNLSPEIYVEFIRLLDQRLFDRFGGKGAIHFCGRGDHYIEAMSQMTGLTAVAMSQPHLNDMEVIYRSTVDKKIKLIGFNREAAESARSAGRPLRGQVHCA